jgi:hypothetical protein
LTKTANPATLIYMAVIELTRGLQTVIDDDDADLGGLKWHAAVAAQACSKPYAKRMWRIAGAGRQAFGHALLHRVIAERMGLDVHGMVVDHINGDSLDNRRTNIRVVTNQENIRNQVGVISTSKTGVPGVVCRTATRWEAWIRNGGEGKRYLGSFKTKEMAVEARLKAERELWGIQPRRAWQHD